jgi:hypothetical protein
VGMHAYRETGLRSVARGSGEDRNASKYSLGVGPSFIVC